MSRRIPITNVTPSGGSPGIFTIGALTPDNTLGDWVDVFQGKFYRLRISPFTAVPFYTSPLATPPGYDLIVATQFDVIENESYAGRYTVYTPVSGIDVPSSEISGLTTLVRVNEAVGAPINPGDTSAGFVTNVSTYFIFRSGVGDAIIVPPGVSIEDSLEFPGRTFSGWGEIFNQNMQRLVQHFAATSAPANPVLGQVWYDLTLGELKIYDGVDFVVVNGGLFAPAQSFRHTQGVSAVTWTINHGLGATAPFIVHHTFYVDIGGGVYKPILPSDVTYVSPNQLTVTFTTSYAGYALVRL